MSLVNRIEHTVSTIFSGSFATGVEVKSTLTITATKHVSLESDRNRISDMKRDNAKCILRIVLNDLTEGVLND